MKINRYRAYRCTGELYTVDGGEMIPKREENILLWLRNGHYHVGDLSFCMEFGSYDTHGGEIHISKGKPGRYEFGEALWNSLRTNFEGQGSLATPDSPRSDDEADLETHSISLSFFDVGDKTGVKLELAPYAPDAGALVELIDAQRRDLSLFMKSGNPEGMMNYDVTDLVYPDGHTKTVDTYHLHDQPDSFVDS